MNAKTTRIVKEARALFWPWCAVTTSSVLPLVVPSHWIDISPIGFFGGIPLLATLSFGNEFQHRTLSLLLTQPVDRMEIWREKLSVTVVAVVSAVLVFFLVGRVGGLQPDLQESVAAGAWVIAIIASAPFGTLIARSTLGGLLLSGGVLQISILIAELNLPTQFRENHFPANMTVVSIAAFVLLCYAGVMLWLGRRTLARFQVTGGMGGDDLLMAGPDVMPGILAAWFRCRPTGAVLNLVRKELRLLRPLWLITLLYVLGWTFLPMFGLVPGQRDAPTPARNHLAPAEVAAVMIGIFSMLIAILAGSLSLGEERTSGTHSWHMTLPVSARRQWLIKLLMALFAGVVCAVLLPVLVLIGGGYLFGSPFRFVDVHFAMFWLLMVPLLTFASFWCACAVNGTVRAALWLVPVMGALSLAGQFGDWVAPKLVDLVASKFDLFGFIRFTKAVSKIWPYQLNDRYGTNPMGTLFVTVLVAPTLLVAVIQSYRLFRAQLQDSTLSVVRYLLPLATILFLCSFSLSTFDAFVDHAAQQMMTLQRETQEAIEKIQPGTAKLDAAHLLQLKVEDLAKASPLSERTRRWLGNSSITVAPYYKDEFGRYHSCRDINSWSNLVLYGKVHRFYPVSIHLPSGFVFLVLTEKGPVHDIFSEVCE